MDEELDKYLIRDYLDEDNRLSFIYDDIKVWGRRLPPILGGTIATAISSNPVFLGLGATILILEELGIDIKELVNRKKNIIKIELNKDRDNIIRIDKGEVYNDIVDQIIYEIDMTLMVYNMDLIMEYDELKVIINNICKYIDDKKYSSNKYKILSYYYKKSLANVINSEEFEVDYYDMMNGLNYLIDLGIINSKELDKLTIKIVEELNKDLFCEKAEIIKYDFKNSKR